MATAVNRLARFGTVLLAVVLAAGCGDPLPSAIGPADATLAKGGGKGGDGGGAPTVTAADPAYGYQGDADEEITITGSGFSGNVEVAWERGGAADPKISVHSAAVINSTTIKARISIAADAEIGVYDIAVTVIGIGGDRKKGIGTEMFEVTTAVSIGSLSGPGPTNGNAINDAGQIAGLSAGQAFFWEPGASMISLGEGNARGVDQTGLLVAGHTSLDITVAVPVVWTRSALGGAWVRSSLPNKGWNGRVSSLASGVNGNAILIGGNLKEPIGKNFKSKIDRPVLWRLQNGWELVELPYPAGVSTGTGLWIQAVNAQGVAIGSGYVWEPNPACAPTCPAAGYTATALPPLSPMTGISPDGSIVVGGYNNSPAYVYRENGLWFGPVVLRPCSSGSGGGWAHGINSAGIIVGAGCDGAYAWRVSGASIVESTKLPGLGKADRQTAWAISGATPARASGNGVYWELAY